MGFLALLSAGVRARSWLWETVFFAVKIEGAGGFLVAGIFFFCGKI